MSARPSILLRAAVASTIVSSAATPLQAERWQAFGQNDRMSVRIDLDAFKRDGNMLTYRVEITFPNDPRRPNRKILSTSVIDCATGLRKHLAVETLMPDGTVRKGKGANRWVRTFPGLPDEIRQRYCEKTDQPA